MSVGRELGHMESKNLLNNGVCLASSAVQLKGLKRGSILVPLTFKPYV